MEATGEAWCLFQKGRYFEAHEALEEVWRGVGGEKRRFLQGLILLAAALHQASAGRGGRRNLRKAETKLIGFPSPHLGLDWWPLLQEARRRLGA